MFHELHLDNPFGLRLYPGYHGIHTQDQAPGALPNGSRIAKIRLDEIGGDVLPVGAQGMVLGSVKLPAEVARETGSLFVYFIAWDHAPGQACATSSRKIGALQ